MSLSMLKIFIASLLMLSNLSEPTPDHKKEVYGIYKIENSAVTNCSNYEIPDLGEISAYYEPHHSSDNPYVDIYINWEDSYVTFTGPYQLHVSAPNFNLSMEVEDKSFIVHGVLFNPGESACIEVTDFYNHTSKFLLTR